MDPHKLSHSVEIFGQDNLASILGELINASQKFGLATAVEPLPYDFWTISVKPDAAHILNQIVAKYPEATKPQPIGPIGVGSEVYAVPVQFKSISERYFHVRADSPEDARDRALRAAEAAHYQGFSAKHDEGAGGVYVPGTDAITCVTDEYPDEAEDSDATPAAAAARPRM